MAVKKEIMRTGWREAGGILLHGGWILLLLSLVSYNPEDISWVKSPPNSPAQNFIGPVGAWAAHLVFMTLGVAGYLAPVFLAAIGLMLNFKREGRIWTKALWMAILLLCVVCLLELNPLFWDGLTQRLNLGENPGGLLGRLIGQDFLILLMGTMGAGILATALLVAGLIVLIEVHPLVMARWIAGQVRKVRAWREARRDVRRDVLEQNAKEQKEIAKRRRRLEEVMKEQAKEKPKEAAPPPPSAPPKVNIERLMQPDADGPQGPTPELSPAARKPKPGKPALRPEKPAAAPPKATESASAYQLPPLSLLDEIPAEREREIPTDLHASSALLKETLSEFGVEVDVTNVERGPVVTRYELLPAPGVRVERIVGLGNNIALSMKAESVRVQAPIPGKGVVGIEVSNPKTTLVCMREVASSEAWTSGKAALPLVLGKDVGGRVIVADLAEMPHLLIAGATGSGKTVCMNSILSGLLLSRTPEQLRLMLIDPKIVEFSNYNHLPHLVVPVITDSKKVGIGLRWAITEMENRYKLFAKVGVRNIRSYNSRPLVKQSELFGGADMPPPAEGEEEPPERVPYIVIVVDELADLMLVAQAEIENYIARLAQLSRAVGIHMILATQRPSVNVITGTIKANFPARIAFQVAQKTDSRTILDANGADKLLGKGDMLFLPPGVSKLIRAQGALTSDGEIHRIVEFCKKQGVPNYEGAVKEKIESTTPELPGMEESDELIAQAIEIIRQTHRASTSSLQRRLRIGYTRAARLIDMLEERGIVGPPRGADPREILIDLDGEIPQNGAEDENA